MEERQAPQSAGQQKLTLQDRKRLMVTGVRDILSFDVNEILFDTNLGGLLIRGNDLHVNRLMIEKGEADVTGRIDSMQYSDMGKEDGRRESVFRRLFA